MDLQKFLWHQSMRFLWHQIILENENSFMKRPCNFRTMSTSSNSPSDHELQ